MLMEGATEEDVKLIRTAPIKTETENGVKESVSSFGFNLQFKVAILQFLENSTSVSIP